MGASRRSSFGRAGAISTTSIPRADESNSRTLAIVRAIEKSHLQLIVRIEYGRRGSSWHRSMP
jgi:hypothetical protein